MKPLKLGIGGLCCALLLASARGDEISSDKVTVPLSNPAKAGILKATLATGGISVTGADVKEVTIEASRRGGKVRKESSGGSHRIAIAATGLTVEEADNVVTAEVHLHGDPVDLKIETPIKISLRLNCMNDGDIKADNIDGEVEASNLNGDVVLDHVSGTVLAHSLNGKIVVNLVRVDADKPMSFSTMNGDIDVTLPTDISAQVKLETENGEVFSDFDIDMSKIRREPKVEDGRKEGGKYRIVFDKGVFGSINGGKTEMKFKTVNGSIHLHKAGQPGGQ